MIEVKTFYMQSRNGQIRKVLAPDYEEAVKIAKSFDPDCVVGNLPHNVKISKKEMKEWTEKLSGTWPAIMTMYLTNKEKNK